MNPNLAEEHLHTIRTLMERSALYRRALAPIMLLVGATGILGGVAGWLCRVESNRGFVCLWIGVAVISLTGALLLARRQALKDTEPFWSPPTRRVGQALLPAFFIGLILALLVLDVSNDLGLYLNLLQTVLVISWTFCYGCAVHAAGFFISSGVRWLGWIFIISGFCMVICVGVATDDLFQVSPHLLMACIFGGLQLAYGIYLYFTEKKTSAA